jgi:hypothetical protein
MWLKMCGINPSVNKSLAAEPKMVAELLYDIKDSSIP